MMTNPQALPKEAQAAVERAEKASEGPWEPGIGPYGWDDGIIVAGQTPFFGEGGGVIITNSGRGGTSITEADADFIAHAREDIPMLYAGWAEDRAKLEAMGKWGEEYGGWTPEEHDTFLALLGGSEWTTN